MNPPRTQGGGQSCTCRQCIKKQNPAIGNLPCVEENIPFYKHCFKFNGTVPVPHLIYKSEESLSFATQTYNTHCCSFTVCVVTECCRTDSKNCENKPYMAELQACIRQNGHVDLYVLNVPGMPSRWVYLLDAPLERVQQEFEGFQIPEGPGEEPAPAPPQKNAAGLNEEPVEETIAAIAEKPETIESAVAEVAVD